MFGILAYVWDFGICLGFWHMFGISALVSDFGIRQINLVLKLSFDYSRIQTCFGMYTFRHLTLQHIQLKWQKIQHGLDLQNNNTHIKSTSTKHIAKEKKNQIKKNQIKVNARNLQPSKRLIGFRYIVNPECVVDKNNQTLIHLKLLDSLDAIIKATEAVNFYYYHTLEHP